MDSEPAIRVARKHVNGWMTVLALGLLPVGLLACLYVLIGVPAEAQAVGDAPTNSHPLPLHGSAGSAQPSYSRVTRRRRANCGPLGKHL